VEVLPRLDLEARVGWFPRHELPEFQIQGGQTLTAAAGVRGRVYERRRMALYGIVQPGLIRFSETIVPGGAFQLGSATHFTLDLGASLQWLPAARWSPQLDIVETLYVVPGANLGPTAEVRDTVQIRAGLRYRVGPSAPRSVAPRDWRRLVTAGAIFSSATLAELGDVAPRYDAGAGGFISYRLARAFDVDGIVTGFFDRPPVRTLWNGGRTLQALAGFRVGHHGDRVGLFAAVRAGVNSHSSALRARDADGIHVGRANTPVLNVGGSVEIPWRTHVVRFEAGNVISFHGSRALVRDGANDPPSSLKSTQSIQLSTGFGWRF
jgi:hypothetical protein